MNYIPEPIDLSEITLDPSIEQDIELISKNVHETWAKQRLLKGWGYGETRDDQEKTHPCMVSYEDLPEIEKEMDRATVTQTVKMLIYLGYQIKKRS